MAHATRMTVLFKTPPLLHRLPHIAGIIPGAIQHGECEWETLDNLDYVPTTEPHVQYRRARPEYSPVPLLQDDLKKAAWATSSIPVRLAQGISWSVSGIDVELAGKKILQEGIGVMRR